MAPQGPGPPKDAQLFSTFSRVRECRTPRWALLGSSWALLGPLGAILGPLAAILRPRGAILGPSWGLLGSSWCLLASLSTSRRCRLYRKLRSIRHFLLYVLIWLSNAFSEPCWGHFGAILGPFGAILGPSWGHFGAILGPLGASWGHLGAILGPLPFPPCLI